MTTKFEAGKRYNMTFIGDSELHVCYEVTKRTEKTITVTDGREVKTCRVNTYEGAEFVKPMGSYSMLPILSAERTISRDVGGYRTGHGV